MTSKEKQCRTTAYGLGLGLVWRIPVCRAFVQEWWAVSFIHEATDLIFWLAWSLRYMGTASCHSLYDTRRREL